MTIAGHTWTDTPAGRACATCPMTRRALHQATPEDIGKVGWAHFGALTQDEYAQIAMERVFWPEPPPASIWDRIRRWLGWGR